ncbi:glycosyltransferase family 4 protein [Oleidesulfovibrio sp.]|uniref:glycosyltransferase family 4 protein n=1 Tax=Oleidesulfovibrio sp. TaxID=2909707 RepID=UPI003A8710D3
MLNPTSSGRIWASIHPFIETGEIMGRSVANATFLQQLFKQNPYDEYHFFLQSDSHCTQLRQWAMREAPALFESCRVHIATRTSLLDAITNNKYHCFHLSDCIVDAASLSRVRNKFACNIFPITGATHSLSYSWYPSAFLAHMWQGTCRRDALIATSHAGKAVVRKMYDTLANMYQLSPSQFIAPRIEQIPLAVSDSLLRHSAQERASMRAQLGLADTQRMVLITGRVSHYSKMDVVPVLRAFQRLFAEGITPSSVMLVLAGWTDEADNTPQALYQLAKALNLPFAIVNRPDDETRNTLYQAADIYLSASDNVQETFGLTILEAAAAGLPVIASDWNGYRDLVVHEQTGFLIPTIGTPDSSESDTLARVLFDNQYHLNLAQQTAVDIPELSSALKTLLKNPELARQMGEAGRNRVAGKFVWSRVIEQHEQLWNSLSTEPVDEQTLRSAVHPQQLNYASIFSKHPSAILDKNQTVQTSRAGQAVYRGHDHPVIYLAIEDRVPQNALRRVLFSARNPVSTKELLRNLAELGLTGERAWFLILWALKQDLLERSDR